MSDVSGIEISDILGLSQPITKLIETVSVGIGKVYEPRYIKRMAKAKAEEMRLISSTINDQIRLPMKYEDGHVSIDAADANELARRAQNRFLFQEMQKQQNIDAVVAHAYRGLENVDQAADKPVNTDWILRFFDSVATIGDSDMQVLWGKILAGEVRQPGSFSLRTLETVKNISRQEAECFERLAPFVLSLQDARFVWKEEALLKKYDITFEMLMLLSDCGLIDISGTVYRYHWIARERKTQLFDLGNFVLMAVGREKRKISSRVHPLTRAGCELSGTVNCQTNITYFTAVADDLWKTHHEALFSMKIFDREQIQRADFDYDTTPAIREYPGGSG